MLVCFSYTRATSQLRRWASSHITSVCAFCEVFYVCASRPPSLVSCLFSLASLLLIHAIYLSPIFLATFSCPLAFFTFHVFLTSCAFPASFFSVLPPLPLWRLSSIVHTKRVVFCVLLDSCRPVRIASFVQSLIKSLILGAAQKLEVPMLKCSTCSGVRRLQACLPLLHTSHTPPPSHTLLSS